MNYPVETGVPWIIEQMQSTSTSDLVRKALAEPRHLSAEESGRRYQTLRRITQAARDAQWPATAVNQHFEVLEQLVTAPRGSVLGLRQWSNLRAVAAALQSVGSQNLLPLDFVRDEHFQSAHELIMSLVDDDGELIVAEDSELAALRRDANSADNALRDQARKIASSEAWRGRIVQTEPTRLDGQIALIVHSMPSSDQAVLLGRSRSGDSAYVQPRALTKAQRAAEAKREKYERALYKYLAQASQQLEDLRILWSRWISGRLAIDLALHHANFATQIQEFVQSTESSLVLHNLQLFLQSRADSVALEVPWQAVANRTWVISGPNAGGKSAFLAALAQWHYCLCTGLVAVPENLANHWPGRLWFDGGDSQDLATGHSSYSAHLQHLLEIYDNSSEGDWVLVDELGSKTDPEEGGAIAAVWLQAMAERGHTWLITSSHLPSIKHRAQEFGYQRIGLGLQEDLLPDYRLRFDITARSHALEAAQRAGWPDALIGAARQELSQIYEAAAVAEQLEAQRAELQAHIADLQRQEQQAQKRLRQLTHDQVASAEVQFKAAYDEMLATARESLRTPTKTVVRKASTESARQAFLHQLKQSMHPEVKTVDESGAGSTSQPDANGHRDETEDTPVAKPAASARFHGFAIGDKVRQRRRGLQGRIVDAHSQGMWKVEWSNGWTMPEAEGELEPILKAGPVSPSAVTSAKATFKAEAPRLDVPFAYYDSQAKEYVFTLMGVTDVDTLPALTSVYDYMMCTNKAMQIRINGRRKERLLELIRPLESAYGEVPTIQRSAQGQGWVLTRP